MKMHCARVGLMGLHWFCLHSVRRFAQAYQDGSQYFVLLVLTDGVITDFNQTIAAIIEVQRQTAPAMRF